MIVAVTGAHGAIGRAVVRHGDSRATIVPAPPRGVLDLLGPSADLEGWLSRVAPDAIVHLAGGRGDGERTQLYARNVGATAALLTALARLGARPRVVIASSAAVYGAQPPGRPIDVATVPAPINDYGRAKRLQEDIARALVSDTVVARIFNVIGDPNDVTTVVPMLRTRIASARAGDVFPVLDADAVRDFVHVDDVAAALLCAAVSPVVPPALNVAGGRGTTIAAVARWLAAEAGVHVSLVEHATDPRSTIAWSVGDPRELVALGWAPQHSLF